ncbi:hypothetical protein [Bradyrhizobium sp. RDM12]
MARSGDRLVRQVQAIIRTSAGAVESRKAVVEKRKAKFTGK